MTWNTVGELIHLETKESQDANDDDGVVKFSHALNVVCKANPPSARRRTLTPGRRHLSRRARRPGTPPRGWWPWPRCRPWSWRRDTRRSRPRPR